MGECVVTRLYDRGDRLFVVQADPEVLVSGGLLEEAAAGELHPGVTIQGGVMTISGTNRTVVYELGEPDDDGNRPGRLRVPS
jgi:hypothetical protein